MTQSFPTNEVIAKVIRGRKGLFILAWSVADRCEVWWAHDYVDFYGNVSKEVVMEILGWGRLPFGWTVLENWPWEQL